MAYYIATIQVLVDVESSPEASDAIAETIRPLLRAFEPASNWIDWRYAAYGEDHKLGMLIPEPHSGVGFEYALEE